MKTARFQFVVQLPDNSVAAEAEAKRLRRKLKELLLADEEFSNRACSTMLASAPRARERTTFIRTASFAERCYIELWQ